MGLTGNYIHHSLAKLQEILKEWAQDRSAKNPPSKELIVLVQKRLHPNLTEEQEREPYEPSGDIPPPPRDTKKYEDQMKYEISLIKKCLAYVNTPNLRTFREWLNEILKEMGDGNQASNSETSIPD